MTGVLRLFFTVGGRIGRKPFWVGIAIVFGLELAAGVLLAGHRLWLILVVLCLFIPRLCVRTKRLHDVDMSGWYHLIPMGLGFASKLAARGAVASGMAGRDGVVIMDGVTLAIWLVFYIWIGVKHSDPIANEWGSPPVDPSAAAAAAAFD